MTVRRVVLGTGALLLIGLLAVAAERAVAGWLGATDPLVPLIVGVMNAAAVLALGAAALLGLATTFQPSKPKVWGTAAGRVAADPHTSSQRTAASGNPRRRCRYLPSEG